jgi:3-oxoacyl-[acyl-carrier protein] reductase
MGNLDNKIALITGAGRGIGQAIALKLAADGADVAIVDLKPEFCTETCEKARAMGRRAWAYGADVSKAASVEETVAKVLADCGRVDILVNNAGITKDTLLMRMSEADWDAVLNINLKGTFLFTKALTREFVKQRSGRIVNIASVIGLVGNAGQCNYGASKAGVIGLTKSVARELASRSVTCNAVAPGFIETKMTAVLGEDIRKKLMDQIPLRRLGSPEDVANAVHFLASDQAAYITGQVLTVDGGMVM